mmetsp:Transcript_37682/g.120902  ORF Transcript_37682/g.120902 Transcript_37682/m.120902 type:complete len:181 (+) Transcript_37682:778-1320(+)
MKRATDALSVCLAARDVFGAPTVKDALERMTAVVVQDDVQDDDDLKDAAAKTAKRKLPQMLMRTAILAVKTYPSQLAGFVAKTLLTRLATKFSIWLNSSLWKGFVLCCTMLGDENGPNCFDALLALPAPQLSFVLKSPNGAKLKLPVKRHAEKELARNKANHAAPTIAAPVLRLLGAKPP